jgi:hypothetical protein
MTKFHLIYIKEIHALLVRMMKEYLAECLFRFYHPDDGETLIHGKVFACFQEMQSRIGLEWYTSIFN